MQTQSTSDPTTFAPSPDVVILQARRDLSDTHFPSARKP